MDLNWRRLSQDYDSTLQTLVRHTYMFSHKKPWDNIQFMMANVLTGSIILHFFFILWTIRATLRHDWKDLTGRT